MARITYRSLLLSTVLSIAQVTSCSAALNQNANEQMPEIARGNETVYQQFLRGKLVYKPNKDNDEGRKEFRISDLANPLSGTFDIRGCGDSDKYLSISTGFRTAVNPANENKLEVWIVPRFVLAMDPRSPDFCGGGGHAVTFSSNPFTIRFNWGGWNDLGWYGYPMMDERGNMIMAANLLEAIASTSFWQGVPREMRESVRFPFEARTGGEFISMGAACFYLNYFVPIMSE